MQTPLISVIIPCYNQGCFLSETLNSVLAQTYKNWEAIIVNDGSTDNTQKIAQQFCKQDKRFIYVYQDNAGLSEARNTGVRNSHGEFLLPLDSDDRIGSTYMEQALKAFQNNEKLKIVYCRAALFGVKKGEWKLPDFSIERMLGRNCIFCTAYYRRSEFDRVGGYRTNMKYGFEDWDFWLSILEDGGEVYQIDEILFYYRIRRRSMAHSLSLDISKMKYLRRQIWENHKDLFSRNFLDPTESFEYRGIVENRLFRIMNNFYGFFTKK